MKKRNLIYITTAFICILLAISPTYVNAINLTLNDATNDLVHIVDGYTSGTNIAVQPEIDIISLVMNESTVAVTFLATPVLHIDNFYDFIVYWNGDQNTNFTDGHWNEGNIISQTKLMNSTGDIIVNTKSNSSIVMIGNTIYYSILNASLIVTDMNPINMIMDARHRTSSGAEFYRDTLEYNTGDTAPGFSFVVSIIGLTTLVLTFIIKKRK